MSNARKSARAGQSYRSGYLRSRAWFARRDSFLKDPANGACVVCVRRVAKPVRDLELHHLSYQGVVQRPDGSWVAQEADEDLLPMHPACHEAVHRLLDQDLMLRGLVSRRHATLLAIPVVRRRIVEYLAAQQTASIEQKDTAHE